MPTQTLTIPRRFNGPPTSGNGGYVAGAIAACLPDPTVQITLRAPVPLDRELELRATPAGGFTLHDDELLLAEAAGCVIDATEIAVPPAPDATPDQLLDAIEWLAPGFEVVQSHCPDWRFVASETVADSGLHARLLVGPRVPVRSLAADAAGLNDLLARTPVTLHKNSQAVAQGQGDAVLDSPLLALHHFLNELRQCPGATDLQAGDVVTTGTWTDAFAIAAGEQWTAHFAEPLPSLTVKLT